MSFIDISNIDLSWSSFLKITTYTQFSPMCKPARKLSDCLHESTGKTISEVKRISKPSRRMYGGVNDFKGYVSGRGILVISTPKGILTHREAKKEMVGGELLFTMW